MAANLFDPPPKYGIPLSRGGDIYLRFTLTVPDPNGETEQVIDPDTGETVERVKRVEVNFPAGSKMVFAITTAGIGSTEVMEEVSEAVSEATGRPGIDGSKAEMLMDHIALDGLSFDENQTWRLTYTSAEGVDSPVANGFTYRADGEDDE